MPNDGERRLRALVARFGEDSLVTAVGQALARRVQALTQLMSDSIREEIPAYRELADETMLTQSWQHAFAHAGKISALLVGEDVGDLAFVEEHALTRAEQHFPLNAILHSYRIGHRIMWSAMREAAMAHAATPEEGLRTAMSLADFSIQYTNMISVALTESYVRHQQGMQDTEKRRARLLIDELLCGQLMSAQSRSWAESYGIGKTDFYLLVARPSELADETGVTLGAELKDMLEDRLQKAGVLTLLDDRRTEVAGLVIPRNDAAEGKSTIVATLEAVAAEHAFHCGLSQAIRKAQEVPAAYNEAVTAIRYACDEGPVVAIEKVPLQDLFIDHIDIDYQRLLPDWVDALLNADNDASGALKKTLRTYADCDLNVKRAAARLEIHPNTMSFRLGKIENITGVSPRRFRGLTEILTVIRLADGR